MTTDATARRFRQAPVERFDTGRAVLAHRRFGQGPPLLLVHGFPLHGFTWRRLLPALAEHFTCHVVDLVGLGDSEWTSRNDFTWTGHAENLKALADHLGLGRYGVVAQDTGATISRCLVRIDAARVDRLVIINTEIPGHRPPWVLQYQTLMQIPGTTLALRALLRSRVYRRSAAAFGGCFTDLDLLDGAFHEAFVEPLIHSGRRAEGLREYLVGLRDWAVVDRMREWHAEMRLPVLLVWGEDDPTFPVETARPMAAQFPDCRGFVTIPHTKLLPHEEQPDAVGRPLLEFLAA